MSYMNINKQKENTYSSTISDESEDSVFLVNSETFKITDCNFRSLQMFEATNKNYFIERKLTDLYKFSKNQFNIQQINNFPGFMETEFITCDGKEFWGEMLISKIEVDKNCYFHVRITDISSKKNIENELSKSPLFIQRITNANPNSIYVYDIEKNLVVYSNKKMSKILGYSNEDLSKMRQNYPNSLIHPDEQIRFFQNLKSHKDLTDDHIVENEYRLRDKEGNWHWFLFSSSVFSRNEQGLVKEVIGIAQDISERKKFELDNIRLASFPRENPNPILECDFEGKITYINPASGNYMRRLGIELNEFIPKNHNEIVKNINHSDYDYQIEIEIKDKIFCWVYHAVKMTGFIHIYGSEITEQKRVENKLIHDALHDALTGLPNRSLFIDRLTHSFSKKKRKEDYLFAVLFLDLDRFKIINDSLGHMAGDELLVKISHRLKENIRPGDTVARMGGDEFTILLDDIKDINDAIEVSDRIKKSLSKVFKIGEHEIFTTASIGIVLSSAEDINKAEDLLRNADMAMYKAKLSGKDRHEIFNNSMYNHAVNVLNIETDLWKAVDKKEFKVFYLPVISLEKEELIGFESLIRWEHPRKGLLSPVDFIQVAEETGLIIPIDLWLLNESCLQIKKWNEMFFSENPLSISVNLSGKHFSQPNYYAKIDEAIKNSGINPKNLKLEITERILMENSESIMNILPELKSNNIELQIDDFGTGYSSLSYLHKLPINALKIDRSFVSMLEKDENFEVIKTIVMLAFNMKINIIAEGIETTRQFEALKKLNCTFGQGYLFSKPLSADMALKYIDEIQKK